MTSDKGKQQSVNKNTSKSDKKPIGKTPVIKRDLLDILDNFFVKRLKFFFWSGLAFTLLFTLLLFDVKIGPGGDDSAYIMRAYDFIHEFKLPTFQGPLYPVVLSPFVGIFGINLPLLKFLSTIFMVLAAAYFYKAFKNRIPATILVVVFILISFNYYLLFFGSQTYNEAFFMMLQALFFYFALKYFTTDDFIPGIKEYLVIGLLLFLMTLTKNVAYAALAGLTGFFLLTKKWKNILFSIGSFFVFFVPWEIIKRIIWKADTIQFSNQGNMLLLKDFYNPSRGNEDFMGLLVRILDNSNLYLSKHFFKFMSLRPESTTDIAPLLTVIVVLIFLGGLYLAFRKNKAMLFTSVYLICMLLISFISLQKHWDQWRLIIIYFPFMLLLLFSVFYYFLKNPEYKSFQFVIPLFAFIITLTSFSLTSDYVKVQREVISRNLDGDMLYGLTPDWQNYLLMSKWAAKNTSPDYMIACRKPEISFIYGERKFYPILKVPTVDIDSIVSKNKQDSIVYTMFHLKNLAQSEQRPDLKYRNYLQGVISGEFAFGDTAVDNSNFVGIYAFPKARLEEMRNDPLVKGQAFEEPNVKAWVNERLKSNADIAIFQPDRLYDALKKAKVKYAILASLRLNPNENTGNIITTVHRYMYFIQLKYPNAFKEVNSIGTEEPSSLIEINLD